MSYTLDQLLEHTGINDVSGARLTKKASAPERQDLSKLAERCRRAVDATPDERASSDRRALIEKTAAIEIIGRTLAEIRAIDPPPDQVKTASSAGPDVATFIKVALDQGHSPEAIASFIEKHAILGKLWRRAKQWKATKGLQRATRRIEGAEKNVAQKTRTWKERVRELENVPEAERAATLSRMRVALGDEAAYKLVNSAGGKNWKEMGTFKELKKLQPKPTPGSPEALAQAKQQSGIGLNVGDHQMGLSSQQLKKMKTPALYLGGGYLAHRAISGPKRDDRGGGGPVIVTR